ncbi:MAG: stage III sporulation protein AA [Clostridiales bacterium]|nr:stage III sporulation protein AA [Clostridiales bacterium]
MNKTNEFEGAASLLPAALRQAVMHLPDELSQRIQEIRLRQNAPLVLSAPEGDYFVTESGQARRHPEGRLLVCTGSHLSDCFQILCDFSVHTHQSEIRRGYIAARNGCRAGIAGTAVTEQGKIVSVRSITSLCLRVSRRHDGCAGELARRLSAGGRLGSALICGEPASGKTSLLKDLARGFSMGNYGGGCRVAVVDERGELSGGGGLSLCDMLLHYPKAEGIEQAVRCLAPEMVLFDELGTVAETEAVLAGLNSGVTAVATAHGHDLNALLRRPQVRLALEKGAFEHIVLLEGRGKPGRIRRIFSAVEALSSSLTPSDGGKAGC